MKNILKLSVLIAGFALCMTSPDNPSATTATITVNAMSGQPLTLEVPVSSEGTFTKSDLMQVFQEDYESKHPTELGKVMNAPCLVVDGKLESEYSGDTEFPVGVVVQIIHSEQKITLPFGGTGPNKELLVTLTGHLKTIYSSEWADYVNTVEKFINHYREKLSHTQKSIDLKCLFGKGGIHIEEAWNRMSECINKVEIGGIVFTKDLERPGLESSKTYNLWIVFNAIDTLTQITQQGVDGYCSPGYVSGWTIQ